MTSLAQAAELAKGIEPSTSRLRSERATLSASPAEKTHETMPRHQQLPSRRQREHVRALCC